MAFSLIRYNRTSYKYEKLQEVIRNSVYNNDKTVRIYLFNKENLILNMLLQNVTVPFLTKILD